MSLNRRGTRAELETSRADELPHPRTFTFSLLLLLLPADKFKPASIQSSKRGTVTPSGDGAGGVTVHLEGANERDVHGFAGKVDRDAGGGAAGGDMKEILVVWDEEEQVSPDLVRR